MATQAVGELKMEESPCRIRQATRHDPDDLAKLALLMWTKPSFEDLKTGFDTLMNQGKTVFFLPEQKNAHAGFARCRIRHDDVEGTTTRTAGYPEGILPSPNIAATAWPEVS